jgi:hypothetical protein
VRRWLFTISFCRSSCSLEWASEAELAMTKPARPLALSAEEKSWIQR